MNSSVESTGQGKPGLFRSLMAYSLRKLDKRPLALNNFVMQEKHNPSKGFKEGNSPKVSIVIPTRDKSLLLSKCVDSIRQLTQYPNFEIIIVNNLSSEATTYSLLEKYRENGITVIDFAQSFNYSKICNYAAENSSGEFICFLNNDTEVRSPNWLSSMVDHASQKDVGVVGALLTYPDGSIQHMGIALGYTGVAGHPGRRKKLAECLPGGCYEVSGVTFACAMVSRTKFLELDGLDEIFPVGFNDVDYCVRSANAGLKTIVCIDAILTHGESQTRKRTFTFSGAIQAAKDVLRFLSANRTNFDERFFSVKASE